MGKIDVKLLGRGYAWIDTGTVDSLVEATEFVKTIQKRQGIVISAPEEIAFINNWISKADLIKSAKRYRNSLYGKHLLNVIEDKIRY